LTVTANKSGSFTVQVSFSVATRWVCCLHQLMASLWRHKQLLFKSTPYTGGTNSGFLYQLPTLVVQPYTGGPDAANLSSSAQSQSFCFAVLA